MSGRRAGVNVPLFSLRSTTGWGIGELTDIEGVSLWLASAGFSRLLLLPLGTMPRGQTSPYSAVSTLSIDPLYLNLDRVPDFSRAGGIDALTSEDRAAIEAARRAPAIRHDLVTQAKEAALGLAYRSFLADEWEQLTPRASELAGYIARERYWLDDYALFLAIARSEGGASWLEWPRPLRERDPRALDEVRRQLGRDVLEHQYRQWLAEGQWQASRASARRLGVEIYGDLPFVASADSPEVWAHPHEFDLTVSVGVPPDAFSPTGQDWGLPMYRWDAIRESGYGWLCERGRRVACLYDGLRVDHVIGVYRTYGRPASGEPFFSPADEPTQTGQGEAVLSTLSATGLSLIAEDLGVIPDFVRASIARLGIPGCKVFRWERDWHTPGAPFIEPATFAATSAAMTGTHDTEPLAAWWTELGLEDRRALLELAALRSVADLGPEQAWTPVLCDALLEMAYTCGSNDVFFPIQDLFGWPDRVNVPGTVGPENWTWALPSPLDQFIAHPEATDRAVFLRTLAERSTRWPDGPMARWPDGPMTR